jgi:thiamine biosynthesis lipoprotein ApbE
VTLAAGVELYSSSAIAKGYVVDLAGPRAGADGPDASPVLVAIGGDLVVRGEAPRVVDVRDPRFPGGDEAPICRLRLSGRALASSGGYARGYDVAGRRRSRTSSIRRPGNPSTPSSARRCSHPTR